MKEKRKMYALEELKWANPKRLLWYQQVDEDTVKEDMKKLYKDKYDDTARRLAGLFSVGTDSSNVAKHLIRYEKARIAKAPSLGGLNDSSIVSAEYMKDNNDFNRLGGSVSLGSYGSLNDETVSFNGGYSIGSFDSVASQQTTSTKLKKKKKHKKDSKLKRDNSSIYLKDRDYLNESHALTLSSKLPGGRAHVPNIPDPYEASIKATKAHEFRDSKRAVPPNISARSCSKVEILHKPPVLRREERRRVVGGDSLSTISGHSNLNILGDERKYRHTYEHLRGIEDLYRRNKEKLLSSSVILANTNLDNNAKINRIGTIADVDVYNMQVKDSYSHLHSHSHIHSHAEEFSVGSNTSSIGHSKLSERGKTDTIQYSAIGDGTLGPAREHIIGDGSRSDEYSSFTSDASAMDQMLVGCGRIRLMEDKHALIQEKTIADGLKRHRNYLNQHASWLKDTGTEDGLPENDTNLSEEEKNIFLTMDFPDEKQKKNKEFIHIGSSIDNLGMTEENLANHSKEDISSASISKNNRDKDTNNKVSVPLSSADNSSATVSAIPETTLNIDTDVPLLASTTTVLPPSLDNLDEDENATVEEASVGSKSIGTSTWLAQDADRDNSTIASHLSAEDEGTHKVTSQSLSGLNRPSTAMSSVSHLSGMSGASNATYDTVLSKDRPNYVPKLKKLIGIEGTKNVTNPHELNTYQSEMSSFLDIKESSTISNPWRSPDARLANMKEIKNSLAGDSQRSGAAGMPALHMHDNDPTTYDRGVSVSQLGNYAVAVQSNPQQSRPSRNKVMGTVNDITRRDILMHDTRIVELGTVIKALQDNRLDAPGIASILDLHTRLLDAASLNPNPWVVHRKQFMNTITEFLPWVPKEVFGRLFSAYDPKHSGVIRFVQMSAALVAGSRPQMADLIGILSEDTRDFEFAGEIVIIKLIHYFYEQCEGGKHEDFSYHNDEDDYTSEPVSQSEMLAAEGGVGMRLSDLSEALSICAVSEAEILEMHEQANIITQTLFDQGQLKDIIAGKYYQDALGKDAFMLEKAPDEGSSVYSKRNQKLGLVDDAASRSFKSKSKSKSIGGGDRRLSDASYSTIESTIGTLNTFDEDDFGHGNTNTNTTATATDVLAGHRTGEPGSIEFERSFQIEKQRTSTEREWRKNSDRRRRWQAELATRSTSKNTNANANANTNKNQFSSNSMSMVSSNSMIVSQSLFAGGQSKWSTAASPHANTNDRNTKTTMPTNRSGNYNTSISLNSLPEANVVLRHQNLRAVKHISRISKKELVKALMTIEGPIEHFSRTIKNFRRLLLPYTIDGSLTYEEAKHVPNMKGEKLYGTRTF